jgi:hypothetical protein
MWSINIKFAYKKIKQCIIEQKEKINYNQKELNELYELQSMNIAAKYSYLVRTVLMSFYFASIFPLGFGISSIGLIFGIALFNLGAETSMSVMGEQVGSALMKTKKLPLIFGILFLLGLLITIAEPDLSVLSSQVSSVINKYALIIGIGVGVGLFLVIAVIKIITKQNLSFLIMFFYMVMFALTCLLLLDDKGNFLALCMTLEELLLVLLLFLSLWL